MPPRHPQTFTGPAALHSFRRGRRLLAIRDPHAPPHPHEARSSVEKTRLHLFQPRDDRRIGRRSWISELFRVAHVFRLSWDYGGHALVSDAMPYFCGCAKAEIRCRVCGRLHVGAALCAAEVVRRSLVWCSGEGDDHTRRYNEVPAGDGTGEAYKLYGPELKNVTPMADNIRLPFLRTLYAGDPRVLRSIITPRLEEVHVQPFNKEFREVNLPLLLFLIERSGSSLRKLILGDCIPAMNKFISILRASPTLEELGLSFTEWDDRMDSCLLEILPSIHVKRGEEGEGEGGTLVPRLAKLNILVQHKRTSRTVPSMSFLRDTLIDAVENRRNHQVAGVAKLASVEVRAAVLAKQDMVVSPGVGNVERWNRLKEGGMEALFHVLGGKEDDECPPPNSRMLRVDPDPYSRVYLQREYV